jgi:4-amino-4-deoxy-L-arabinose transferase-like glycosyltransferase
MTESKTQVQGAATRLVGARRGLSIAGVAFVVVNLALTLTGSLGGSLLSAVLWGAAAVCFLGSFAVYMMEPAPNPPAKAPTPAGSPKPESASAPASPAEPLPSTVPDGPAAKADKSGSSAALARGGSDGSSSDEPKSEAVPAMPLLRKGNPLRLARGGVTALVGGFVALLLMAHAGQWRWGVPVGVLFVAVTSWGIMDLLGTFDDPDDRLAGTTRIEAIAPQLAAFVLCSLFFCLALGGAAAGMGLAGWQWGIVVTLAFVGGVVALFETGRKLGAWATDEEGAERPIWKRHGFWVVVLAACLYFPFMGTFALWDPWETHYGEVSREMLARDDWISLWWAQDGWFWSKPVLDMWMQAVSMATLGVHYMPDKMLTGDGRLPVMHPEWAVRAPVVLLTIVAMYLLYKGVAKTFGRRAALLGAIVLATTPDWFFLAHQTMTDMPFVGAMTACMGLILIGLRTPEGQELRAYEVRFGPARVRFTGWHLVFGAVLMCAVPQILYLLSRNFEFVWKPGGHGFHAHWDEFRSGSGGGNCGLPGNEDCHLQTAASIPHSTGANPDSFPQQIWRTVGAFEPAIQAIVWALVLGTVLYMNWGERRARRIIYLAAWFFAAISTLGKGPAGFALPMLCTFAYLCASRPAEDFFARIKRIVRELVQFEIVAGLLIILAVALPWYVAMYVRHGSPFTDRLIFHDMFNRAFHHVHDTNEGDDTSFRFYVWQLGYALFPWTGLAPLGLLWWMRRGTTPSEGNRADTSVLLCMWFVFAFALFSFMGTKFHHYIFPAVPPVAMLVGVVLDDMLSTEQPARGTGLLPYLVGVGAGGALLVLGISRTLPGSFFGAKPDGRLADPALPMGLVLIGAGLGILVLFVALFGAKREPGSPEGAEERTHVSRMLAAGAVAGALLLVLVTRDLAIKPENADQPGAIRLLHLFTYNYRRPWPESLDFSAPLAGFGAVAVLLSIALAIRPIRRHAVAAMCAFAVLWTLWGLDVYLTKTAPHWGQHEVIAAYYADRQSPSEELVAYQMNWKGENFYTGNHVPAFVSTGGTFTNWLKKKREDGAKVMYFVTEHGRIGGLKSEVAGKSYREVTTKELCNKFVLVRVEL